MSARAATAKVSYNWHLRMRMAERGMFATSDLVPLLAERGVVLSREQVYRLVAKVPERVNLTVLAALCDASGSARPNWWSRSGPSAKRHRPKATSAPGSGAGHPPPPGPGGPHGVSPGDQQAWRDLVALVWRSRPGPVGQPGQLGHQTLSLRAPGPCRCWPGRCEPGPGALSVGAPPLVGRLVAELRARGSTLPEPTCARCGRAQPELTGF